MTQLRFEQEHSARWTETELLLEAAKKRRFSPEHVKLPMLYRQLCADLSLARHRMYGARLCGRLNELVIGAREILTRGKLMDKRDHPARLWSSCPRAVRREWRLFWLNMLLFWGPFVAFIIAAYSNERWIFAVLDADMMSNLDDMYGTDNLEAYRGKFGSDFAMFAFYIYNNISIGLRTIAGGVLAAVGALFSTAYQGVVLGAAFGYVHYAGHTDRFYAFVAGHSAFELMGLVICGVAGTRLGMAVLNPGDLSRADALKETARGALPLIYGGPLLVLLAAFIEGFWSASSAPAGLKLLVGAVIWVLLATWLLFAGRGGRDEA
ncbi:MAG: hypothetical protein JWL81_1324 [Verrucomicrobiales bacterium]|nr:hypothetical protein [Verrucomicrobiales bacterium]